VLLADVVVLTADNFEDQVVKSEDGWLVEFYAPVRGNSVASFG
jgi:hypothetical protein